MSAKEQGEKGEKLLVEQEEEERDEEGLLKEYDVIICGTGLVQSILASALCRAGKSVLHCDGQGHYGELDAVLNLPYLESGSFFAGQDQKAQVETITKNEILLLPKGACQSLRLISTSKVEKAAPLLAKGMEVSTPYGKGIIVSLPCNNDEKREEHAATTAVSMTEWTLADGTHPVAYFGSNNNDETILVPTAHVETNRIFQQSRSFALDVSPRLLFASGSAVTGLLTSSVSDYLEFKSVQGLFWMSNQDDDGTSWQLSRVPCSKGDVFATKLLKPLDKRRLMKFLQLALDYATTASSSSNQEMLSSDEAVAPEEEVQSLNERQLNQGRSLARPQNKAVSTNELQRLQQCILEDMDFETYLKQEHRLSPHLSVLVRHALALETTQKSCSTLSGMTSLCQHMQALGNYGTTAFLVPLYGSGELPQCFCRSAAVHGGIYLLRRAAKRIVLDDDGPCVKGVVLSSDDGQQQHDSNGVKQNDKMICCKHVVVSGDAVVVQQRKEPRHEKRIMLRRISILRGQLVHGEEQRHVILFPPMSFGHSYAIHGIAVDSGVCVAPAGCTVLHLSTTCDDESSVDETVLKKALDAIQSSQPDTTSLEEIYHVSFYHDSCGEESSYYSAQGLHQCRASGQHLVMDHAFDQAQEIFQQICPDSEFLKLSKQMDEAVKARIGERDDDDDEKQVLESAMDMMKDDSEKTSPAVE